MGLLHRMIRLPGSGLRDVEHTTGSGPGAPDLAALDDALDRNRLTMSYMPEVAMGSGRTVHTEALLRWRTESRNIPPAQFLPLAQASGRMPRITRTAARIVIAALSRWRASGLVLGMTLNLSSSDLDDPDLANDLSKELNDAGVAAEHLWLEISSRAVLGRGGGTTARLDRFRDIGVGLVLDNHTPDADQHIAATYDWSAVKLDRNWVMGISQDPSRSRALRRLTRSLHEHGLTVIAAGVHTSREWDAARAANCDRAAGYYLSPPQCVEELDRWFRSSTWRPHREVRNGAGDDGELPT